MLVVVVADSFQGAGSGTPWFVVKVTTPGNHSTPAEHSGWRKSGPSCSTASYFLPEEHFR